MTLGPEISAATGQNPFSVRLTNRGRPQCSYQGQQYATYILSLALHDGLDLAKVRLLTAAGTLTVGHKCENKKCDRAEHLKWQDRGENTQEWFENRRLEAATAG